MKKNFLKFWLFFVLVLTTSVFYSCSKNDDPVDDIESDASKIVATNVIYGSSQITDVKAEIYWGVDGSAPDYDYENDIIAQTQYENNGFTLELPATLPDKYLSSIINSEDFPSGVTVSDKTAKWITWIMIEAYSGIVNIGSFYLSDNGSEENSAIWIYVDKNVTIKGESKTIDEENNEEDIANYDMNLKKGWNILYGKMTKSDNSSTGRSVHTFTVTSKKPLGVNYYWYYKPN